MPVLSKKPEFPFTNTITPDTLRSYFLNLAVDVLLLDVRPEAEFERGYVGYQYVGRGCKINVVWIDPTILMRDR
jgi:ubiquitin carboxyl-terminal hydrolase 8